MTRTRRSRAELLLCAGLLGLAGCMHDPNTLGHGVDNDPLVGVSIQAPVPRAAAAPVPATVSRGPAPVASPTSLPAAPNPSASTAALAAGSGIHGGADNDPRLAPDPHAPAVTAVGATSGVILQGPSPDAASTAPPRGLTAVPVAGDPQTTNNTAPRAPVDSLQKAYELIRGYGGTDRYLEEVSDGVFKFSCRIAVPSTGDERKTTNYVVTLPGEDGLAAVRAVLQQIEKSVNAAPASPR